MGTFEVGKTYTINNQGKSITPQKVDVTIVWIEDDAVHYRFDGDPVVKQTPLSRFEDIFARGFVAEIAPCLPGA